jgi:hypothetical protein
MENFDIGTFLWVEVGERFFLMMEVHTSPA